MNSLGSMFLALGQASTTLTPSLALLEMSWVMSAMVIEDLLHLTPLAESVRGDPDGGGGGGSALGHTAQHHQWGRHCRNQD